MTQKIKEFIIKRDKVTYKLGKKPFGTLFHGSVVVVQKINVKLKN